jgi:hypothetical protein
VNNLLERLDERWGDDRGVSAIWCNYRNDGPWWDITRHFHPLLWSFGVEIQRELACSSSGHWLMLSISFGPFSLTARREWSR